MRKTREKARILGGVVTLLSSIGLLAAACLKPDAEVSHPLAAPSHQTDGSSLPASDGEGAEFLAMGLIGSKHDFTDSLAHPRDLCTPCHTPHLPSGRAPLLDPRPAAADALPSYQGIGADLDSSSLLCLSCHDGVSATDVFTPAHGASWDFDGRARTFGGRGGHPIGVRYPQAEPTYHAVAIVTADGRIKLPEGRVQCISCHDPHNTHRHRGMLVRSNRGSRLCLSCHRL